MRPCSRFFLACTSLLGSDHAGTSRRGHDDEPDDNDNRNDRRARVAVVSRIIHCPSSSLTPRSSSCARRRSCSSSSSSGVINHFPCSPPLTVRGALKFRRALRISGAHTVRVPHITVRRFNKTKRLLPLLRREGRVDDLTNDIHFAAHNGSTFSGKARRTTTPSARARKPSTAIADRHSSRARVATRESDSYTSR